MRQRVEERIQAAPGFQLFGSVTTDAGRSSSTGADPLAGLRTRVVVEPPGRGRRGDGYPVRLVSQISRAPHAHARDRASGSTHVRPNCGAASGESAGLGALTEQDYGMINDILELFEVEAGRVGTSNTQANDANHTLSRVHAGRPFLCEIYSDGRGASSRRPARSRGLCVRTRRLPPQI